MSSDAERQGTGGAAINRVSRGSAAVVGALTIIAPLAASELAASLLPGAGPGLLDSVGGSIIDAAPQPVVEGTIVLLGPLDKPVLVVAVFSLAVLAGLATGFAARGHPWVAGMGLSVLGRLDLALALRQPGRSAASAVAAAVVVVLAASATVRILVGAARRSSARDIVPAQDRTEVPGRDGSDLRTFLTKAGWVAAAAVVGGRPVGLCSRGSALLAHAAWCASRRLGSPLSSHRGRR